MATPQTTPITSISNFKGALTQSGARANLFQIDLGIAINTNKKAAGATPDGYMAQPEHKFWVKAGQVPGSTESILPINSSGGRVLKIPGLRTFDDWTCTVINDDDSVLRSSLINWMLELSGGFSGFRGLATAVGEGVTEFASKQPPSAGSTVNKTPSIIEPTILGNVGYKTRDIKITQFNQRGEQTQQYTLVKAWPNAIADIPLDWSTDGIEEFTVTFSYDYWTHTSNAITVETTGNVKVSTTAATIDVESPIKVGSGTAQYVKAG